MSGSLLADKNVLQAPTFSPMDAFKKCHLETRLRIKEVVEHIVMNNIELTIFLMLSHQFLNEHSINSEASSGLKEKLECWYDDILSSCLNFKRSSYRHISDFKFNLGTLKGCEKLFFGLDKVTETFRNSSMIEDLLKNGNALRTFFSEMVAIIEPSSEPNPAPTIVTNTKVKVETLGTKPQQLNLEVDVPKPIEMQAKPQNDQQIKQAVTASPKPKTLVKTMDTNSLLGALARTPLQPVLTNTTGPAAVSGQSTPEPKSVKTYLSKPKSPPAADQCTADEAPRQTSTPQPQASPARVLFGMSFGPDRPVSATEGDKENRRSANLAKDASKDFKHSWMLDTILGKNFSSKPTAEKNPPQESAEVFALWNSNGRSSQIPAHPLKESGFASLGLADMKRVTHPPELAEVQSKSMKDDRFSFADNFMTEQTMRSLSVHPPTTMNLRLLESRATNPGYDNMQTQGLGAGIYSTNNHGEVNMPHEPNFVSNTSEQNKLLKNFLTFSNMQGVELNLKDSQTQFIQEQYQRTEMRSSKEGPNGQRQFGSNQQPDRSKHYRSEAEPEQNMKSSLAKRHSTVGRDEANFCSSEMGYQPKSEQFLSHKSDQVYFDKLQKKLDTEQKNQHNPLFDLIESVDDRSDAQPEMPNPRPALQKKETMSTQAQFQSKQNSETAQPSKTPLGRELFHGASEPRFMSHSSQEQARIVGDREQMGDLGTWTYEGTLLHDASPQASKGRQAQRDTWDDLNNSKHSQGMYVERNTPSRIKCVPGTVCPITPIGQINQKSHAHKESSYQDLLDIEHPAVDLRASPEPASKFDTKQFLVGKKAEKLHVNMCRQYSEQGGLEKIVLSNNGKFALFGGKGLHVLDMRLDKFRIVRNDKQESRSCC